MSKTNTVEEQIRAAAEECGLTEHEARAAMAATPLGAIGDGAFLKKFLSFLQAILPILIPLVTEPPAPKAAEAPQHQS